MSQTEGELRIIERGDGWFKVQHHEGGNISVVEDTFAEMLLLRVTSPYLFLVRLHMMNMTSMFLGQKP